MEIIKKAKERFKDCENWEAQARFRFEYDYKFAHGDTHNKYQWDNDLVLSRELESKPCLTVNKTRQHNLMIINDAKQNKPGVRIRPVGDEATYEGAQIYQELVYHIEYISSAENVYDSAVEWQVDAGWGYWRILTDYVSEKTFDQEIYIRRVKDPRSVYLDHNTNERDRSDARFGFIFEDVAHDLFKQQYPDWAYLAGAATTLGNSNDMWITKNYVRIAEYFYKEESQDKLVTFIMNGRQILEKLSDLEDMEKQLYKEIKKNENIWEQYEFKERDIITENITWCKIAGDRIIEEKEWLGKYIPIVFLPGTETVIDGVWDCKGHTRALINAQQIYNYNTSSNVEYGALQTKSPWLAPTQAIEGYEEYYKNANRSNYSYLPYNAIDDDGNVIPPPSRPASPQASPAYIEGLKIAQNEMMMASGQYQAQFGEAENAKSGVAINARQRQGDRATYHFIDNQAIAIRLTGKIIIDLIPKIYDTPRVKKILAQDGTRMNVDINTKAEFGLKEVGDPNNPTVDNGQKVKEYIFNPDFGMYDIQADTGPSFATKRMETAAALMEIAKADKNFMGIGGDILFKNMDFAGADVVALRYNNVIPPNIKGGGLPPEVEETMNKSADLIEQLQQENAEVKQKLADKEKDLTIKAQNLDLNFRKEGAIQAREDYKAQTQRVKDLFNTASDGHGIDPDVQVVLKQLIRSMVENGELDFKDNADVDADLPEQQQQDMMPTNQEPEDLPEGAVQAPDGMYYVQIPEGGWARVEQQ